AAHREVGDLYQIVCVPEGIPRGGGIVGIGLVECPRKWSSIHEALKPPDFEKIVAEAAAHSQAGDVRDSLRGHPGRDEVHGPAAYRQPATFPQGLIDQHLVAGDDRVAYRPDAAGVIKLAGLLKIPDLLFEGRWWDQVLDQDHRGSAEQHARGCT